MPELSKGHVFVPGEVVDPADLNDLVDAATALKGIITDQPPLATSVDQAADMVLLYDASAADLRKALVQALPGGVTSIGMTVAPTTVFKPPGPTITTTGTFNVELKDQGPNKVLAGPAIGTAVAPSFRTLESADIALPTVAVAATTIDWSQGNVFDKTLPGSGIYNFNFTNVKGGQTVKVCIKQSTGSGRVNWDATGPTLIWNEVTETEMTTTANGYGIYVFTAVVTGGVTHVHGYLENESLLAAVEDQSANTFFAGPESGADAAPTFRAITPADTVLYAEITSNVIDCTVADVFRKNLSANTPFNLINGQQGQRITVYVIQHITPFNWTVNWSTGDSGGVVRWPGGVNHTMTTGSSGRTDIINFLCMGSGQYYGTFNKDFTP